VAGRHFIDVVTGWRSRFRGEQIVVVVIQSFGCDVIADMKQLPLLVKHEAKIHNPDMLRGMLLQMWPINKSSAAILAADNS
jgi:hypothetical protein